MTKYIGAHGFPETIGSVDEIIAVVRSVGKTLLEMQPKIMAVANGEMPETPEYWVRRKPDGSIYTSADVWADQAIREGLKAIHGIPRNVGYISEEAEASTNQANLKADCWLTDPLDSTGAYTKGFPTWSVNTGYLHRSRPTGGVVYYPALGKLFYTSDYGTSVMQDEVLGVSETLKYAGGVNLTRVVTPPGLVSIFAGQNVVVEADPRHTNRLWAFFKRGGPEVAEHGKLFYAWDIAAPAAIAARAGVVYVDRNGKPLDYLASRQGHNDFELPKAGFLAGHRATLAKAGFLARGQRPA
ncbi:MAG: hypothetical protein EBQ96_09280 [Proteobacteria bacterium]|nr:hypothetical protein [Pseudomonadota bacterium]